MRPIPSKMRPIPSEFYEKYSSGLNQGNKLKRTDSNGKIKLILKDEDGWSLKRVNNGIKGDGKKPPRLMPDVCV